MLSWAVKSTFLNGSGGSPRSVSDMELTSGGGGIRLRVSTADTGELLVYSMDAGGNVTLIEIDALPTNGIAAEELCAITIGGEELLVALVPLSASVSQLVAFNPLTGQTYAFAGAGNRVTSIAVVEVSGSEFVYVAYADGSPIDCFERDAGGDFVRTGAVSPVGGAGIAGLEAVEVAGKMLLIVSDYSGEIRSFLVSPDGSLTLIDSEGAGAGLGISGPAEAECVTVAGVTYVVQAATGSSSLSVLRIESDGSLTPTDHVIDSLHTRFQSVTALEAVTINGQVYLIAGGADGGISLFLLLPGGTLYHLGTIVDSASTTLSAVNSIEAVVVGGKIQVFVSSGDSPGFTQITLTPGPAGTIRVGTGAADTIAGSAGDDVLAGGEGADVINGGSGDDFLLDGAGADTLTGGAGADIFVLSYDQEVDVIMDFDRTKDRLDLSAFPLLRNVDQLQITPMPWGARISYLGEVLDIHTADGMPLTAAQIAGLSVVNLDHYMGLEALVGLEIDGTDGDDVLEGTQMQDALRGRMGNDTLLGHAGHDTLLGDGGYDRLEGGEGDDSIDGGDGDDELLGQAGNDTLNGGEGNDNISMSDGDDLADGGGGDDRMGGGLGNDTMDGGLGNDFMGGGPGDDTVRGGPGRDVVNGGPGNDLLEGGDDADTMGGSYHNDTIYGGGGDDNIGGGAGADLIYAGTGNDTVGGGPGIDTIHGEAGDDFIAGGDGGDLLDGGAGNDRINGGAGNDTMDGGIGADTFVFNAFNSGEVDLIVNFEDGVDRFLMIGVDGNSLQDRLDALNITDTATGVSMTYNGHVIYVEGVSAADLTLHDFTFV